MNTELQLRKWQKTIELLAELYGASSVSIVELKNDSLEIMVTSGQGSNCLDDAHTVFPLSTKTYCRRVLETDAMLYVKQSDQDLYWQTDISKDVAKISSYLGFPIKRPDQSLYGTICIKNQTSTDYSEVFIRTLEQFRDLVEADLLLEDQKRQLERMANTDVSTGCANRRGLENYVQRQSDIEDMGWGVLYFDLDNLKATNDRFGHQFGDQGIELLGNILSQQAREDDIAARVGGDEFVLIARLPSDDLLEIIKERIMSSFEQMKCQISELSLMGVSVGVSFIDASTDEVNIDTLLTYADEQMYHFKKAKKEKLAAQGIVIKRS